MNKCDLMGTLISTHMKEMGGEDVYIYTLRERERDVYGMQEGMGAKIFTKSRFFQRNVWSWLLSISLSLSHTHTQAIM